MATVPYLKNAVAANPAIAVPLTTYLLLLSFGVGLPGAIAYFPQFGEILASELEEPFRAVRKPGTGELIEKFWYNKGL